MHAEECLALVGYISLPFMQLARSVTVLREEALSLWSFGEESKRGTGRSGTDWRCKDTFLIESGCCGMVVLEKKISILWNEPLSMATPQGKSLASGGLTCSSFCASMLFGKQDKELR